MENVQLTESNRYSIFLIEEDCIIHPAVDNNVVKNNLYDKNHLINQEEFKEQNKVINKTDWNQSDQEEIQCTQGLSF
jgi:predicted transcriptional regulator